MNLSIMTYALIIIVKVESIWWQINYKDGIEKVKKMLINQKQNVNKFSEFINSDNILRNRINDFDNIIPTHQLTCKDIGFIGQNHSNLCKQMNKFPEIIFKAAHFSLIQCQNQLKLNPWNCTYALERHNIKFITSSNSPEKAFIYALTAAATMYSMTSACSSALISQCGCDESMKLRNNGINFQWGSCSDDVNYGERFSTRILDTLENPNTQNGLINLWNYKIGREVVKKSIETKCKCYGISGSCSLKMCHREMASFTKIAEIIKNKFDLAIRVKKIKKNSLVQISDGAEINNDKIKYKIPNDNLVYFNNINNCAISYMPTDLNLKKSKYRRYALNYVTSATNRECSLNRTHSNNCEIICCNKGYRIELIETTEQYGCHFVWCCRTECLTRKIVNRKAFCN